MFKNCLRLTYNPCIENASQWFRGQNPYYHWTIQPKEIKYINDEKNIGLKIPYEKAFLIYVNIILLST